MVQKIAAALEISVTELLAEEAVAVRKARNNGLVGKVREVFDRISKLPRRQQEHIVNGSPPTSSIASEFAGAKTNHRKLSSVTRLANVQDPIPL